MDDLTLLEKFAAGWEIRHRDGTTALQVVKYKSKDKYWIEWSDGVGGGFEDDAGYIICTPPRERRWVNVWVQRSGSGYLYTTNSEEDAQKDVHVDSLGDQFIATLCIERVDGKWILLDEKGGDK
jgi:hypothetical protein